MHRPALLRTDWYQPWLPAAFLAVFCGLIYSAARPPLFDFDGYMYRLYALLPSRFYNVNPQHLLWNSVQILLANFADSLGRPTTVPFQIFGILVNCATLLIFYSLLWSTSRSPLIAAAGVLLVAFSPWFWYLGLQNHPYPLVFLAVALYLWAWNTKDGNAPSGLRLLAAGLSLAAGVFFHQAVILLLPAATLVLLIFSSGPLGRRSARALAWAATIATFVLTLYLYFWRPTASEQPFFRWSTDYVQSVHPIQLFQFGFPASFARSIIGISESLVQAGGIESFLANNFSGRTILAFYGWLGVLACLGAGATVWWEGLSPQLLRLMRSNALFTVSLLSLASWSAFTFAWEAATGHYWTLGLLPALVCLGLLMRERAWHGQCAFAAGVVVLAGWNGFANYNSDRVSSRNFPPPLLASIEEHVGSSDIFVVLGSDGWYGDMNYDLLFQCLRYSARNPGIAILNDFVIPAAGSQAWRDKLRDKIESTLDSGGRVFVASHVFDRESYLDLAARDDPFTEQINEQYLGLDGPALYRQVGQLFKSYELKKSQFRIGTDEYFTVQRRRG